MTATYWLPWWWSTYQEQPEGVAYTFHEQLILPEILLVDVEDLAIVEPADEEEGKEEAYDHVDPRKSQQAHGEAEGKGDKLAAPEHEVKQFILISSWFGGSYFFCLGRVGEGTLQLWFHINK